ncbi:MAG: NAD-dependent epimerase/dehydratase family protein [Planctomycetota bacterium]|jgi:nucleoside-diphosphate-sugar epimerase
MVKKVLVTGALGFIGNYFLKELENNLDKEDIFILERPEKKLNSLEKKFNVISSSLDGGKFLANKIKNIHTVYHLAGNIRTLSKDIKEEHYRINSDLTKSFLESCKSAGVKRFVFISTSEVYGENLTGSINEYHKTNPVTDYAKSKFFAEECCKEFSEYFIVTVIRLSYIYGFGQPEERLFPKLIKASLEEKIIPFGPVAGGNDFIYAKDAAKGIFLLGNHNQKNTFEIFNLSSGKSTSFKEIFKTIGELTGKKYQKMKISEEKGRFHFDISKSKEKGFFIEYDLEKGLQEYINFYKDKIS